MGKNLQEDAAPIKYLRLLLRYLEPEDKRSEWEKDVWKLENFGFEVRQNPIDVIRTIKFTGIIQETIREEVKRASYIRIKYLSVGSLQGEIRAVRRFSEFLAKRNPEIKSLGEVGRLNIEEYLTYINLERGQERNLKTEMANLKNMLQQVGKVIDKPKLGKLFIKQDMPKAPEVAFKIYSDEEIKRLNYYIVNMEEQVARALILHQMLGGRISDTLTLRTDCLYQENGHYIVRMYQVKTSYYEKPIPDDVAKLIQKSMEYTYERYGETEYVFVNESNPSLPFQYSMLKHRVYTLIHENDICKDNGERMGFATHLFRHCYGMKLVELHLDDAAIAHLLGHGVLLFLCFLFHAMKNKTDNRRKQAGFSLLVCIVIAGSICGCGILNNDSKNLQVTVLDVGQGDCIFIRDREGKKMLVDGGSSDLSSVGTYRIEPFLLSQGVRKLEYVFVTHGDADHINGIQELLQNQKQGVEIDALVLPPEEYMDEKLLHLAEIAKENGTRVLTIYAGEKVGTYLKCIAPLTTRKNERIRGKEEEMPRLEAGNEASVVLELKDGAFQMLLTGDLEGRGEEQLVESGALESCPILKAGHHGSKNSGSEEFLQIVKPRLTLISAGIENRYGHPHEETLERLQEIGSEVLSTQECGAITLRSDGRKIKVHKYL